MEERARILCVDDEPNVLRALERMFLDEEYEILTAPSALEGLQALERIQPVQIVVSDYRMPAMNGVDFLREVCRRWPDTVRIVLSGYADTAAVVAAINDGEIYKFIPKPWNDDELRVTIANAAERYFLHRRNRELLAELTSKNEELEAVNRDLERIIEARTAELVFRNRVLTLSRNILDALPVAVFGIDPEGLVAQCNGHGAALLGRMEGEAVGVCRRDIFPAELNDFVDRFIASGPAVERMLFNGAETWARAAVMDQDGQSGIIVVLGRDGEIYGTSAVR